MSNIGDFMSINEINTLKKSYDKTLKALPGFFPPLEPAKILISNDEVKKKSDLVNKIGEFEPIGGWYQGHETWILQRPEETSTLHDIFSEDWLFNAECYDKNARSVTIRHIGPERWLFSLIEEKQNIEKEDDGDSRLIQTWLKEVLEVLIDNRWLKDSETGKFNYHRYWSVDENGYKCKPIAAYLMGLTY